MSTRSITIRPFGEGDATAALTLLRSAAPDYVRFFRPFEFEIGAVNRLVRAAQKDRWFSIEIVREGEAATPVGFYMLRGIDEGFADPMYGIFIAEEFSGLGLARLSLAHAESMCRLNGWPNLLLKVDPANVRAFSLYEASGFRYLRVDPANGNQVLIKPIPSLCKKPTLAPGRGQGAGCGP
ncbi:MAG: GNAT family N-acetyltransferase [Chthoniobacteraceae bacterium]